MIDEKEAYYALNCDFNIKGGVDCECGRKVPAPTRECNPTEEKAFFIHSCGCGRTWEFTVKDTHSRVYTTYAYLDAERQWCSYIPKWKATDLANKPEDFQ